MKLFTKKRSALAVLIGAGLTIGTGTVFAQSHDQRQEKANLKNHQQMEKRDYGKAAVRDHQRAEKGAFKNQERAERSRGQYGSYGQYGQYGPYNNGQYGSYGQGGPYGTYGRNGSGAWSRSRQPSHSRSGWGFPARNDRWNRHR